MKKEKSKCDLGSFPTSCPGLLGRQRHGPPGGGASAGGGSLASGWRRTAAGAALHSRPRSRHHAGHERPEVSELSLTAGVRLRKWYIWAVMTVTIGAKMPIKCLLTVPYCAQICLTCVISHNSVSDLAAKERKSSLFFPSFGPIFRKVCAKIYQLGN